MENEQKIVWPSQIDNLEDPFRTSKYQLKFSNSDTFGLLVSQCSVKCSSEDFVTISLSVMMNPTSLKFANGDEDFDIECSFYDNDAAKVLSTIKFKTCYIKDYSFGMTYDKTDMSMLIITIKSKRTPIVV